jgi:hypothetical protein
MIKLGPYVCHGVIDCGRLMDIVSRDVEAAKAKSREDALRMLKNIKAAHADWLDGHHLSGRALRRAGTPFSFAYDDLERWLSQTRPTKPAQAGFVYVIGIEGDPTAVKIGFACRVADRLSALQTSSHHTLNVLVAFKATRAREKELHRKFAAERIRGEWFRRGEAIDNFIAECAATA